MQGGIQKGKPINRLNFPGSMKDISSRKLIEAAGGKIYKLTEFTKKLYEG